MHRPIKRFGFEGQVKDDSDFARLRSQYEDMLIREMRDLGYVPVLGFGPFWSTEYDEEEDLYNFVTSVYGVYVGRRRSWQMDGISVEGKDIPRIAPNKSNPSSQKSE